MALKGMQNPCAGNESFTLGYTIGELELLEELRREARPQEGTSYHQPPSAVQLTHYIGQVKLREQMNQDF